MIFETNTIIMLEVSTLGSINYRELKKNEIDITLFKSFNRYQEVKKCWRKENGEWVLKDISFTEQWSSTEYEYLITCLQNTVNTGGAVIGAFENNELVGFASVESKLLGSQGEYVQLSCIHTSYENRGLGIGKKLFCLISKKAKELGAQKLYISSHSSEESHAFYKSMGCVEALEYNAKLIAEEPWDCQLEYILL
jgi:ribosomal protein S18 acetylase RimI-like enzyme